MERSFAGKSAQGLVDTVSRPVSTLHLHCRGEVTQRLLQADSQVDGWSPAQQSGGLVDIRPTLLRGTEDVGSGAIESPDGVIRLAYDDEQVTEAELLTYWPLSEREAEYDEYLEDVPDSTVVN